ncbi:hypothetical protein C1645_758229 [Glomus cerebriforme]|uniref:Uncharacterized protein n=1 Tax=Glomus cerebriforme TaxID=658196 RepID=A0A397TA27_9GLOM|nr:hypothetical protein C1645_758229 [Glomus cerebriforme]
MSYNYHLQNNNAYNSESIDNRFNRFNNQLPTNVTHMGQSSNDFYNNVDASCSNTDYFSVTDDNIIPPSHPNTSITTDNFVNNEYLSSSHAPQYTNYNVDQNLVQNPSQTIQNMSSPSFLNSCQTNEIFRFEIPGFKIFIVPTSPTSPTPSSPIVNLNNNMQNQDLNYFDSSSSNIVTDDSKTQFQLDSNGSFIDFNNF